MNEWMNELSSIKGLIKKQAINDWLKTEGSIFAFAGVYLAEVEFVEEVFGFRGDFFFTVLELEGLVCKDDRGNLIEGVLLSGI